MCAQGCSCGIDSHSCASPMRLPRSPRRSVHVCGAVMLQWFLLLTVVLTVVIAVLNVGVSSANNKMPTTDFSTPEQPPGDTRRKVSGFLGFGSMAAAWR